MQTISKYIGKQLVTGGVIVTLALACLIWLTQSLKLIELIMSKGLSFGLFLKLTMLLLPNFLIIILPIAFFAVTLFVYNRMVGDRELIVLRSAGLSPLNLSRPALLLGVVLTLFSLYMTLETVPSSVRMFREMKWKIRHDVSHLLLQEGAFTHITGGLTVYVRERKNDGTLRGIMVHDTRDKEKKATVMAETGRLISSGDTPKVVMVNGNRQEVRRTDHNYSVLFFDRYTMDFGSLDEGAGIRFRDARERTLSDLLTAQKTEHVKDVDIRRFRVEAHKRLTLPFYNLLFALIACAGIFSGSFNRRGQLRQVLMTVGAMVMVQAGALGAENLASNKLIFMPLLYVNLLLPLCVAGFMLVRPSFVQVSPVAEDDTDTDEVDVVEADA